MRYKITYIHLDHNHGTKEYAIDFIEREDGAVLLIFAWGKTGALNKLQSHFFKPSEHKRAHAMRNKKYREKLARNYSDNSDGLYRKSVEMENEQELERLYRDTNNWWLKIPENHRKLITSDIFENPDLQELVALQSETTNIDMTAIYANHPLYGRF